jgi:hypothetical protein
MEVAVKDQFPDSMLDDDMGSLKVSGKIDLKGRRIWKGGQDCQGGIHKQDVQPM